MGFNRIEAKFRAKVSIRQGQPNVMKVALVYLLLTSLLSMVVNYFVFDPRDVIRELYYYGYGAEDSLDILNYVWGLYASQIGLFSLVSFALSIYSTIMGFGFTSYALRLSRNEDPELSHIFDGFLKILRVLWMTFLKGFFTNLWALLGMLPGTVFLVVGVVADMDVDALVGLFLLSMVLAMFLGVMATLRYSMSEYCLLDDPSRTARECITQSKKLMKGRKMELLTLEFSFVGWMLCGELLITALSQIWYVAGVVGMVAFNMWYLPYYSVTQANFYNFVSGWSSPFSQGDTDWDSRMKDFNDAFDKPDL